MSFTPETRIPPIPIFNGSEMSMSKRSPMERHSSALLWVSSRAFSKGSRAGFDFPQVSRPTISGKNSETPRASRVFRAGRRGLLVTQIILYFAPKTFRVCMSFSSFERKFFGSKSVLLISMLSSMVTPKWVKVFPRLIFLPSCSFDHFFLKALILFLA